MSNLYKYQESDFASFQGIQEEKGTLFARFHREASREPSLIRDKVCNTQVYEEHIKGIFDVPLKNLYKRASELEEIEICALETFKAISFVDNMMDLVEKNVLLEGKMQRKDFHMGEYEPPD
jgi:hypothetical protein